MSTVPDVLNSKNSTGAVRLGNAVLRSSLALVLIWIGGMKFTSYEAMGIQPLVATSPLMSWLRSVRWVSEVLCNRRDQDHAEANRAGTLSDLPAKIRI